MSESSWRHAYELIDVQFYPARETMYDNLTGDLETYRRADPEREPYISLDVGKDSHQKGPRQNAIIQRAQRLEALQTLARSTAQSSKSRQYNRHPHLPSNSRPFNFRSIHQRTHRRIIQRRGKTYNTRRSYKALRVRRKE